MNSLVLVLLSILGYLLAYKVYGRYIAVKVFNINDTNKVPSKILNDGIDYIPTKKNILFGHHFTTIAGLGPIVGPAIGLIWGWGPAFAWVFVGSIFMGAVHDFSCLVISSRYKGKTMGELTGVLLNPSTKIALQFVIQLLLLIVLSIFALIVSTLFIMYPQSVIPVWAEIPIAIWLGRSIRKGANDLLYSIIALVIMYLFTIVGVYYPIDFMDMQWFVQLFQDAETAKSAAVVV